MLGTLQAATGVRLAAGIKVLVRALREFSAQYGLTLHVDAIDPSYTLGDLEAKKRQTGALGLGLVASRERDVEVRGHWSRRSVLRHGCRLLGHDEDGSEADLALLAFKQGSERCRADVARFSFRHPGDDRRLDIGLA